MKAQFYLVSNPIDPNEDDTYIYHSKSPRFHARIILEGNSFKLEPVDNIDDALPEKIDSKVRRMENWYRAILIAKKK